MSDRAAIILAAGKSTRMMSGLPKVMHEVCGRPMLSYVLCACRLAGVDRIVVVVGHGREGVVDSFGSEPDVVFVEQAEQLGTGHAVMCCREALAGFNGSVLVIAGDMPLVKRVTLANLMEARERRGDAMSMATAVLEDPSGYGRIIRGADGAIEAIVEQRNCTDQQRSVREVNTSFYCFDSGQLFEALAKVQLNPESGETYLTDVVSTLRRSGAGVSAETSVTAEEGMGVNSRIDLAAVGRIMQDRIQESLMEEGVTIIDPDNTWIDADVTIGKDSVIHPFTVIAAGATIGEGCRIGPLAYVAAGETVPDQTAIGAATLAGAGAQ